MEWEVVQEVEESHPEENDTIRMIRETLVLTHREVNINPERLDTEILTHKEKGEVVVRVLGIGIKACKFFMNNK